MASATREPKSGDMYQAESSTRLRVPRFRPETQRDIRTDKVFTRVLWFEAALTQTGDS